MTSQFSHLFVTAKDFDQSLDFYANVLGWEITDTWGDAGQSPRRASLTGYGGTQLLLNEKTEAAQAEWMELVCAEGF